MVKDLVPAHSPGTARAVHACRPALAACLAALLAASGAASAQVLIDPVIVQLGARQRVATVTVSLSDKAAAPMRLQAEVLRWQQGLQGEDITEPSIDLLVAPAIAEVKPGQKQLFRVALRGARSGPAELAYRLVLEDIAPPQPTANAAPGLTINFRMRYDLPVLVAPEGPGMDLVQWRPCASAATEKQPHACVRVRNDGNQRVKIQTLTLAGDGWQQDTPFKQGVNVLAGAERELRVPLEKGNALPVRTVRLQTTRGTTLQAEAGND